MYSFFLFLIILLTTLLSVFSYNRSKSIILCFPLVTYILWFFVGFSVTENSLVSGEYFYYSSFFRLSDIADLNYFYSFLMYLIYFLSYSFVVFLYLTLIEPKQVSDFSLMIKNTPKLLFGWRDFLFLLALILVLTFLVKNIIVYTLASGSSFYHEFRFGMDSFRKNAINLTMWSTLVISFFFSIFGEKKKIPILFLLLSASIALLLGGRFHVLALFFMYFIYYIDVNGIKVRHLLVFLVYIMLMLGLLMAVYIVREFFCG